MLDYDIEANISPETERLEGRVRMRIRTRSPDLSSLMLRLADELAVRNIVSVEYGRLLYLRVRDQDNVIVNFPVPLRSGAEADAPCHLCAAGSLRRASTMKACRAKVVATNPLLIPPEPNFLLSSRSYWYPQNPITDYATATLRVIVPEGYGCAASGLPRIGDEVTLRDLLTLTDGRSFVFTARGSSALLCCRGEQVCPRRRTDDRSSTRIRVQVRQAETCASPSTPTRGSKAVVAL